MTAGLTFATRSANPAGRCMLSAALAVAWAGSFAWWNRLGPTAAPATPRPATVARRTSRRAESAPGHSRKGRKDLIDDLRLYRRTPSGAVSSGQMQAITLLRRGDAITLW